MVGFVSLVSSSRHVSLSGVSPLRCIISGAVWSMVSLQGQAGRIIWVLPHPVVGAWGGGIQSRRRCRESCRSGFASYIYRLNDENYIDICLEVKRTLKDRVFTVVSVLCAVLTCRKSIGTPYEHQ